MIDLRSDTVTKPSAGMREAIARAEVGDDVFGEDPTVNRLQDVGRVEIGDAEASNVVLVAQPGQPPPGAIHIDR